MTLRSKRASSSRSTLFSAAKLSWFVATLIRNIFGHDPAFDADQLHNYVWRWNVLNVFRMALVAATTAYLFSAFRTLDRTMVFDRGNRS
jgi:hypothetical protein